MLPEQQISRLEWFLKDHVTVKTGGMNYVNLKSNPLLQLPSRKQTPVLSLPENQTGLPINLNKLVCGVKCFLCCKFFPWIFLNNILLHMTVSSITLGSITDRFTFQKQSYTEKYIIIPHYVKLFLAGVISGVCWGKQHCYCYSYLEFEF